MGVNPSYRGTSRGAAYTVLAVHENGRHVGWANADGVVASTGDIWRAEKERLLNVGTIFNNTTSLPLSLLQTILVSDRSEFMKKDASDTAQNMVARGISYVLIFSTVSNLLMWGLGPTLMGAGNNHAEAGVGLEESGVKIKVGREMILAPKSRILDKLRLLINVPVLGILAGIVSAAIPSIKRRMLDVNSVFNIVYLAMETCGRACVPLILVSLGCQLALALVSKHDGGKTSQIDIKVAIENTKQIDSKVVIENNKQIDSKIAIENTKQIYTKIAIENTKQIDSKIIGVENSGILQTGECSLAAQNRQKNNCVGGKKAENSIQCTKERLGLKMINTTNGQESSESKALIFGCNATQYGSMKAADKNKRARAANVAMKSGEVRIGWVEVSIVLAGRFVIVPGVAVVILSVMKKQSLSCTSLVCSDPVFFFSMLLLSATPPAINLITLAQTVGKYEESTAIMLLWGYLVGAVVLSANIGAFMFLTKWIFSQTGLIVQTTKISTFRAAANFDGRVGLNCPIINVVEGLPQKSKLQIGVKMVSGITVKDVNAHSFIKAYAAHLKKTGKLQVPEWTEYCKTAAYKELSPNDPDWFYVRTASIARHIYLRGGVGVGALAKVHGGRFRHGTRPSHHAKASAHVMRVSLQALEAIGIVEKDPNGGRKITPVGQRDLDRISAKVVA
ncbi:hypothetical protein BB561_006256 [Smittium simulii]|uniref:40S ribosomal protein S19 n=1 Tax=Smittium simulii TaxID=133385 RepID=A0A2T9Y5H6_9FUNG|nr:hypothetical protein BB561_006256 [Smittium simulii]